jgi:thiol:disulfide interchange protein
VKRTTLAIAAVAAIITCTACSQPDPTPPAPVETVSNHATVTLKWEKDMSVALERAQSEGKPVLVNFYAEWCVWCKRLESTTLRDAKVASVLDQKVVPLSLDVDAWGKELSNEYRVHELPTIIVLDAEGKELGRIPGYLPPESFLERVEGLLQQS